MSFWQRLLCQLFGICPPEPPAPIPPQPINRTISITINGLRPRSIVYLRPDIGDIILGGREGNHISFVVPAQVTGGAWLRVEDPTYNYRLPDDVGIPLTDTELQAITIPSPELPRLRVVGREVYAGDEKFVWRGATAFKLLELVAHGRLGQARTFLQQLQGLGFNLVRVLAVLEYSWFHLDRHEGRAFLGELLTLCQDYGFYVEVVALADTKGWSQGELEEQVREVGHICAFHTNAVLEIANEPYHPTQSEWLNDAAYLRHLRGSVNNGMLIALGASSDDEAYDYPGGDYVTAHLSRSRDPWNMVRRVRELEALSQRAGTFVVNDEPMGADEVNKPGSRLTDPAIFYTLGVLGRIFGVGSTFHCTDGLYAQPLQPTQLRCAQAFIHGTRVVPDRVTLTYKNAGWHDSPVKEFTNAVRVYSGIGAENIAISLGIDRDASITWQNGWNIRATLGTYPGVIVYLIER